MIGLSISEKMFQPWLLAWARARLVKRRRSLEGGPRHLLFALCDHFEPLWAGADSALGLRRVERWLEAYPSLARSFRDASGRPPKHTFFFPLEQYRPEYLDRLARLVEQGLGEVEIHLHHDADNEQNLRSTLYRGVMSLRAHGLLGSDRSGRPGYGFIHGNWCLANSRKDGRWCGVDSELAVLFETGCFADFTFPSAPDATQPTLVDSIYWPSGDQRRPRAHEQGEAAKVGESRDDRVLCIQGPLALARKGRLGLRIENGALTAQDPATPERVRSWFEQEISVEGRPEWIFVKVHTHGAGERQAESLLGAGGQALHQALRDPSFVLHYVSAREMFNVALAAMHGRTGDPREHFDYAIQAPPVRS